MDGKSYIEFDLEKNLEDFIQDGHVRTFPDNRQLCFMPFLFERTPQGKWRVHMDPQNNRHKQFMSELVADLVRRWGPEECQEQAGIFLCNKGYPKEAL
jgi:hypothetical protein